jgi:cupin 2 domain-containing protein
LNFGYFDIRICFGFRPAKAGFEIRISNLSIQATYPPSRNIRYFEDTTLVKNLKANLFATTLERQRREIFETVLETDWFRLERIISTGQATPAGQWYDQETNEWVALLSGSAGLLFEGEGEPRVMRPGDHVIIPAHLRHRVEWTDPDHETVWLALHY